ncbi:MAG: ABC transporter ATP-binding protein [Eubacterium sp.]
MTIQIEHLSYAYPRSNALFKDVSFTIEPGHVISILGPNGAGKTTLLNCIANLFIPLKGRVCIDGIDMRHMTARSIAQTISYVPQTIIPTFSYSVLDYVVTGCTPHIGTFERPQKAHYDIAVKALRQMKILHLQEKSYTEISGGERQQVSIARALAQKPSIILMDEPTAHLDYGNQIHVLKIICEMAKHGYGIVLTTHNPDHTLLLDDQLAALTRNGDFFFGRSAELLTETFLQNLYNIDLKVHTINENKRPVCFVEKL